MKDQINHWNKESFVAYILIHAANADFIIAESEKDLILKFVSVDAFNKALVEYKEDNDFQSIEKIQAAKTDLDFCDSDCDELLSEMEQVFKVDNKYEQVEHNMFMGLRKLLKQ